MPARYPGAPFAPGAQFPELHFAPEPGTANPVYQLVRDCLRQAGLDAERFGQSDWNPLGEYISPGQRVFLLCNFVYHRRPFETAAQFTCKCTHASVIRAVADYALIALDGKGEVVIGNAPLQSCDWDAVLDQTGTRALIEYYRLHRCNVRAMDLRCYRSAYSTIGTRSNGRFENVSDAVAIDLGRDSLLAELPGNSAFAVTDYDPADTQRHHRSGRHSYAVHREILAADAIIGIPKLKVHEKVGLTCGLKNYVGTCALKQTLPHHRIGSPRDGGDEYPERSPWSALASQAHARYARLPHGFWSDGALAVVDRGIRRLCLRAGSVAGGAWHGNDTAWRMAGDLFRIAEFADRRGVMQSKPQRRLLTVVDGIVAGEGEGPLAPQPVPLGTIVFSDDTALADWACCELIGFDVRKVPLVYQSLLRHGIDPADEPGPDVTLNQRLLPISQLNHYCQRSLLPPRGWRNYVERQLAHAAH